MMFPRAKNLKTVFMSIAMVNFVFIFVVVIIAMLFFRHIVYEEEVMLTSIANSESELISEVIFIKDPHYKKELSPTIPEAHTSLFTFGNTGDSVIALSDVDKYKFLWSARDGKIPSKGYLDLNTIFLGSEIRSFFLGYSSIMLGLDHKNICVLSTSVPIKGTNLNLITKIDVEEFLLPYAELLTTATAFGVILMTLASLFLFYIISKPLRAEIKEAAINLKKSQEEVMVKESIIFSLATLAAYRDNDTAAHIYRTRDYAVVLAKTLGMDENFINSLYKVSCLHDMGKVAVPDSILLKKGPLNKDEFEKIKYHTLAAKEILEEIIKKYGLTREELTMAENIAYGHHEKWDGTGYPQGLKNEGIPMEARIFAVADVYDALTSKRPYKDSFDHDLAIKILFEGDERTDPGNFDPKVLEALKQQEQEFKKIKKFYDEYSGKLNVLPGRAGLENMFLQ